MLKAMRVQKASRREFGRTFTQRPAVSRAPRTIKVGKAKEAGVMRNRTESLVAAVATLFVISAAAAVGAPCAHADNKRLNDATVADVYNIQHQAGCTNDVKKNPQLQTAAQWHADDLMSNRELDGDIGSDGSTPQDRANAAGFHGKATETVAINPALAISGIELFNKWYYDPASMAIMSNCANSLMGVWSENSLDRTVVVAVYGQPN